MNKNLVKSIVKKTIITLTVGLAISSTGLVLEGSQANASTIGWKQTSNGSWYYYNANGNLTLGWQNINGNWYYLDTETGVMVTGWKYVNGTWYYLNNPSGEMATGWLYVGGTWYYLDTSSGAMYTGTHVINGKSEYFTESGAWVPNKTTDTNTSTKPESKPETKPDNNTTDTNTTNKNDKISLEEFTKIADDTMLDLVNKHRAEKGISPLKWNKTLAMTSTEKSEHMRKHNYMDHVYKGVDTSYLQSLRYKITMSGENALANYHYDLTKSDAIDMANSMFNQWKNSPGHDRAMLDPENIEMGFGFALSNGGTQYGSYGIQQFSDGEEYQIGSITMKGLVDDSWLTDESPDYLKELV